MFRIHKEQMSAFHEEAMKAFEDRLAAHLYKIFPAYCEAFGQEAVTRLIRYGVRRAERHGIVVERGLFVYVDAMFAFGRDFDEDPRLPWAAKILRDPEATPLDKADRLFDAAFEHLDEARGIRAEEAAAS